MTVAAHEELHVFLMAWIPVLDGLMTVDSPEAGREHLEKLRSMLTVYDAHFE